MTQIEPGGQEQVHHERHITLDGDLVPGIHTLRVRACDLAFNYSEPAVLRIEVPQPGTAVPAATAGAPAASTAVSGKPAAAASSAPGLLLGGLLVAGLVVGGAAGWRRRRRARPVAWTEPTRPAAEMTRDFNPFIAGRPVDDPRMFFARHDLLQRIVNGLHNNSVMIHGERHLGKTSLLYQLAEQLRRVDDPEWVFVPVYVDVEGMAEGRFFYLMMEGILGVTAGFLPLMPRLRYNSAFAASYTDRDLQADLRVLLDVLHGATGLGQRQVRMILLLDEADTLSAYDILVQQQFRRILIGHLAGRLGVVMSGTAIHQAWSSIDCPWHNMFQDIELELFDDAQARALLTEPVRGYYEWEPQALEKAIAVAEGRPGRLQQLGLVAVEQMLRDGRTRITIADVEVAARRDADGAGDPAAHPWE